MESLEPRKSENSSSISDRKLFLFQGRLSNGKMHTLKLLQHFSVSKGRIDLITETTEIAISLYKNDHKLNSLHVLGIYRNDYSDGTAFTSFKYGLGSGHVDLLCKAAIITVVEAPMMDRELFKMVDVVLKY